MRKFAKNYAKMEKKTFKMGESIEKIRYERVLIGKNQNTDRADELFKKSSDHAKMLLEKLKAK